MPAFSLFRGVRVSVRGTSRQQYVEWPFNEMVTTTSLKCGLPGTRDEKMLISPVYTKTISFSHAEFHVFALLSARHSREFSPRLYAD